MLLNLSQSVGSAEGDNVKESDPHPGKLVSGDQTSWSVSSVISVVFSSASDHSELLKKMFHFG